MRTDDDNRLSCDYDSCCESVYVSNYLGQTVVSRHTITVELPWRYVNDEHYGDDPNDPYPQKAIDELHDIYPDAHFAFFNSDNDIIQIKGTFIDLDEAIEFKMKWGFDD
jgi:hypothetical protein